MYCITHNEFVLRFVHLENCNFFDYNKLFTKNNKSICYSVTGKP
jgi:hypothetical protein